MAGIVEEIFTINNNAEQVMKEIGQITGAYETLTAEQQKQLKILADLQKREKELIAARSRSQNPHRCQSSTRKRSNT